MKEEVKKETKGKKTTTKKSVAKTTNKKESTKKLKTKQQEDINIEQIEQEIINKKKLPKEEENKINKKAFENILIADILMVFLYFISLGSLNIETSIFLTDLKVFSLGLIIFTIILFEISYKKENGNLAIHGIECLVLAIFMLFCTYLYTVYMKDFYIYVSIFSYIAAAYYVGKAVVIHKKMKKKYYASLSDIDEIIKK